MGARPTARFRHSVKPAGVLVWLSVKAAGTLAEESEFMSQSIGWSY